MEQNKKMLSIGSEFTDEAGTKQVPVYEKDPITGVVSPRMIQTGIDEEVSNKNKNMELDIIEATQDIEENKNDIKAIEHYKAELQKEYGEIAVEKLDEMLNQSNEEEEIPEKTEEIENETFNQ